MRFVIGFLLIAVIACFDDGKSRMHDGMYGLWETKEPRYANCYMEIQKDRIIFYNSEQGVDLYHISGIESIPKGIRTLYHIRYKDNNGLEYLLSLFFMHTAKGDFIQFQNQMKFQWSKKKDKP